MIISDLITHLQTFPQHLHIMVSDSESYHHPYDCAIKILGNPQTDNHVQVAALYFTDSSKARKTLPVSAMQNQTWHLAQFATSLQNTPEAAKALALDHLIDLFNRTKLEEDVLIFPTVPIKPPLIIALRSLRMVVVPHSPESDSPQYFVSIRYSYQEPTSVPTNPEPKKNT